MPILLFFQSEISFISFLQPCHIYYFKFSAWNSCQLCSTIQKKDFPLRVLPIVFLFFPFQSNQESSTMFPFPYFDSLLSPAFITTWLRELLVRSWVASYFPLPVDRCIPVIILDLPWSLMQRSHFWNVTSLTLLIPHTSDALCSPWLFQLVSFKFVFLYLFPKHWCF